MKDLNDSELGKTVNGLPKSAQGAIMLVAVVVLFMFLSPTDGSNQSTTSAPVRIEVGDQAILSMSGNVKTPVFTSKAALDAFVKAAVVKDEYGTAEAFLQGKGYLEPNGTKVHVIDSTLGTYQVRVLEGNQTGMAVWVQKEFLSPNPSSVP